MRKYAFVLLFAAAGLVVAPVASIAAEDSNPPKQNEAPKEESEKEEPKKHTVADGQSLSMIATENKLETWRPIWNANTQLQHPDQINPGEQIVIPEGPTADRPLPPGYGEPAPVAVQAAPVAAAPKAAPRVVSGGGAGLGSLASLAARVRAKESGGNYAINTGNGYYGAYQFDVGTWGGYGGYTYASDAPPAVQDAKFAQTYAARGCSPWPNTCR